MHFALFTLHCSRAFGLLLFSTSAASAQLPQAPQYADCRLDSVFSNGGQQGTTFTVTFRGQAYALNPPRGAIIDGPPGITVKELKEGENGTIVSTLETAADAPPGRRWLRVVNERSGLTNFAHFVVGRLPETLEVEPNNDREHATPLSWPVTINARFAESNGADWFRVSLTAGQKVWFDVTAQRFTESPVDTLLQVFDAEGKMLAENDDDSHDPEYESFHHFRTTDSKLLFTAPAAGDFFVKLTEQSGLSGPRPVYRLSVNEAKPDFHVRHFPDAVPIWGPGSTAAVLVKVDHLADFNDDVECSIEGLPPGWKSSSAVSLGRKPERYYNNYQRKVFLMITAPADAALGTVVSFRIIGRAKRGEEKIEHRSWPLTLFYTSDIDYFRPSQQTRVAIAKPQGPWLDLAGVTKIKLNPVGTATLAIKILGAAADLKAMPLVINLATNGVACGLVTPKNVTIKMPAEMPIGIFHIVAAQTWGSDIRVGMPGPCTPPIRMVVEPAK